MYKLRQLPYFLLEQPFKIRLAITLVLWLPTLLICLPDRPAFSPLFLLSVILAAWLFKIRGGLLFSALLVLQTLVAGYYFHAYSRPWSSQMVTAAITSIVAICAIAIAIGFLRQALETTRRAHRQLALAYEQQNQYNQAREALLLNISHELRTPLTSIHGYLELLQDYADQISPATRTDFLNQARLGCEELLNLSSTMYEAAQVSQPVSNHSLACTNIRQVINDVLEHFHPHLGQIHPIKLDMPENLCAWIAPRRMREVLQHLLSNAFKFSPPHSQVTITASAITDDYICISIKDTGPGIPPNEQPLLFSRFVRLKRDISGPVRGSGLGLYICKQIVESMGGHIWVESTGEKGAGSCFSFTLPRKLQTERPDTCEIIKLRPAETRSTLAS